MFGRLTFKQGLYGKMQMSGLRAADVVVFTWLKCEDHVFEILWQRYIFVKFGKMVSSKGIDRMVPSLFVRMVG